MKIFRFWKENFILKWFSVVRWVGEHICHCAFNDDIKWSFVTMECVIRNNIERVQRVRL